MSGNSKRGHGVAMCPTVRNAAVGSTRPCDCIHNQATAVETSRPSSIKGQLGRKRRTAKATIAVVAATANAAGCA